MSSSFKQKHDSLQSDVHSDIQTYCSGHLGPHSLNPSQPPKETKQFFQSASKSQAESPNSLAVKKKQKKKTSSAPFVESEVFRSKQDQAKDYSSHAGTREDTSPTRTGSYSSNFLSNKPKDCSQTESSSSSHPEGNLQFSFSPSNKEGLNDDGRLELKRCFDRDIATNQDICAERLTAEVYERKLQKGLKKLSAQSRPSRDRLAVFSDVFDDVCEGSPVFGRILREIKTEYDLFVNHLMDSQSSQHHLTTIQNSGNNKQSETELDAAEREVSRLMEEATRVLQENKRLQHELRNIPVIIDTEGMNNVSLSGLPERGTDMDDSNVLQFTRRQVLNVWKEIQELEVEIDEKLVSNVTTAATKRHVKELQIEVVKLITSNERLRTVNEDLQNNINAVLNREKASKAIRRMLWSEIHKDLQTDVK